MYELIQLRSRKLVCKEETLGPGKDLIRVGGVAIRHDFSTKLIPSQSMGDYDEDDDHTNTNVGTGRQSIIGLSMTGGDDKLYPVKLTDGTKVITTKLPIFHHDPSQGYKADVQIVDTANGQKVDKKMTLPAWPKFAAAILFLAERDTGGFGDWLKDSLHPKVKKYASKAKAALLESLAKGLPQANLSKLFAEHFPVDVLLKDALQLLKDAILAGGPAIGDDISLPRLVWVPVRSYGDFASTGKADSKDQQTTFTIMMPSPIGLVDGKYTLHYDWRKYDD